VENRRRPDFALSGFAGIGAADATFNRQASQGTFGIYELRVRMSYSLRDGNFAGDLSRSRRELARAEWERDAVIRRVRTAVTAEMLRIDAQRKRIELLTEALDVSRQRQHRSYGSSPREGSPTSKFCAPPPSCSHAKRGSTKRVSSNGKRGSGCGV